MKHLTAAGIVNAFGWFCLGMVVLGTLGCWAGVLERAAIQDEQHRLFSNGLLLVILAAVWRREGPQR